MRTICSVLLFLVGLPLTGCFPSPVQEDSRGVQLTSAALSRKVETLEAAATHSAAGAVAASQTAAENARRTAAASELKALQTAASTHATPTPALPDGALPYPAISPQQAAGLIGERRCVAGTITSTYDSGKASFANYVSSKTGFYAVAFDFSLSSLQGRCAAVCGPIQLYKGRPEIIVDDMQQVLPCP